MAGEGKEYRGLTRNPDSLVATQTSIGAAPDDVAAGEQKLGTELTAFPPVAGGTALDVGASTGGFTRALLTTGAARVYALDVGYGSCWDRSDRTPAWWCLSEPIS